MFLLRVREFSTVGQNLHFHSREHYYNMIIIISKQNIYSEDKLALLLYKARYALCSSLVLSYQLIYLDRTAFQ